MTVVSYHSCLISDAASSAEASHKTSSQILLSRGVADADATSAPTHRSTTPSTIASVYESATKHIMTLGDAACQTMSNEPDGNDGTVEDSEGVTNEPRLVSCRSTSRAYSNTPKPSSNVETVDTDQCEQVLEPYPRHYSQLPFRTSFSEPSDNLKIVDKGKEIERGRSTERGQRPFDPLGRANSRKRRGEAGIDVDARSIQRRAPSRSSTFFDDPNDPAAILEDNLLEPFPQTPIASSVSEVLNTPASSSPRDSTRSNSQRTSRRFTRVLTDCRAPYPTPLPSSNDFDAIFPKLSELQSEVITSFAPQPGDSSPEQNDIHAPPPSIAATLATEILQQIMLGLSPADFNSARHVCRSWYINSLSQTLLETMLRRGGFSNGIVRPSNNTLLSVPSISDEWMMSKRLSRECALGPDWMGDGLNRRPDAMPEFARSAFVRTSTVDFTEIAVNYPGPNSCGTVFTVSSCGRFVMAANGCLVYIYELNQSHKVGNNDRPTLSGALRPVTTIICPRRVLACSMDTSSQRYAIAVLLDGRMGVVSDIASLNNRTSASSSSRGSRSGSSRKRATPGPALSGDLEETGQLQGTSFLDRISLNSSSTNLGPPPIDQPFVFLGIATAGSTFAPVGQSSGSSAETKSRGSISSDHRERKTSYDSGTYAMPIENGPRSLYRNLCSDDDPPRSVAICPQRRCVAFGCSSGIELHWVDALTGQDLNRWFPLTAPSDYLYFLPPRKSVDSAKKLRLISSAARPNERPAIAQRPFGDRRRSSPFWERYTTPIAPVEPEQWRNSQHPFGRLRGDGILGSLSGLVESSDHYRAVPLSDGYHILFTDPATGLLCLGSDAPVGGPTKLLRKIWFQGPEAQGSPIVYAGGSDLRYGVRIVAAYGTGSQQSIWFFSVPNDVFGISCGGQTSVTVGPASTSTSAWLEAGSGRGFSNEGQNTEWINWWPDEGIREWAENRKDSNPGFLPRSVWPIKVRGQKIGACNGVVDLAVDAGCDMTVWAFSRHGIAKVWGLGVGDKVVGGVVRRWVVRDGTVRESDGEGDLEMCDLPQRDRGRDGEAVGQESFDGCYSSSGLDADEMERRNKKMRIMRKVMGRGITRQNARKVVRFNGRQNNGNGNSKGKGKGEDSYGDVLMNDLIDGDRGCGRGSEGPSRGEVHETVVEVTEGPDSYWRCRLSRERIGGGHGHVVRDLVEELTGMTRIEVEIR